MANPQPTDAHLRMAHSIHEAIMMRDFTKYQRKILDLILRLSWGCGKKYAYIPYQKDFGVVGIFESDIKKNLEWLEISKIISRDGPFYWFNKDFDQWQISRVNPFDPIRLSDLLSLNLNGNNDRLSDLLSEHPKLSDLLSDRLEKLEPPGSKNSNSSTPDLASPKEILKKDNNTDNYLDNKELSDLLIFGKTLEESIRIASGARSAAKNIMELHQEELDKRHIDWRKEILE